MNPTDDIISPVVNAMANILSTQITGLGRMYVEPPDAPPEPNSIIFPLTGFKYEGDTNGKEYVVLKFGLRYITRRGKFSDNILSCYKMFSAISKVLTALSNQDLQGNSITVTPKDGAVTQFVESGQTVVTLLINVEVRTEFNLLN